MPKHIVTLIVLFAAAPALGDKVELSDGNTLTGKIVNVAGDKMKFNSDGLGDITLDMAKVKSFTTDEPAKIKIKHDGWINGRVTAADATKVTVEGHDGDVAMKDVKQINPPDAKWTGSIVGNGLLTRGNSHELSLGLAADAALRRENEQFDDRLTLSGAYHYSRQRVRGIGTDTTTADDWFALAKYDKFFTDQFYGYANLRYDHDRIAALQFRLTPGVGVGYQWFEQPDFNLSTEGGVSYVYEEYSNDGNEDRVALRLAYHVDKSFGKDDNVKLFHNLEWLPSFDNPADYNLNADAGVRLKMTKAMFAELKAELRRDSTPAPGALKNDLRYILGVGWSF